MVIERGACAEVFAAEDPVLDAAASVWVVLQFADELPATADGRARVERGRARLGELLAAAGISELEIRDHVQRQHDRCGHHRESSARAGRSAAGLRVLQGGSD